MLQVGQECDSFFSGPPSWQPKKYLDVLNLLGLPSTLKFFRHRGAPFQSITGFGDIHCNGPIIQIYQTNIPAAAMFQGCATNLINGFNLDHWLLE
ncbi:4940_t:CDS:2, partial [Funneliformis mosseae]